MKIVEDVAGKLRQLGFKASTEYTDEGHYRLHLASQRREVALAFPPEATEREVIMGALTMASELQRAELEELFRRAVSLAQPTTATITAVDPGAGKVTIEVDPAMPPGTAELRGADDQVVKIENLGEPSTDAPPAPAPEMKAAMLAAAADVAKTTGSTS